jgi:hypothetical protein
MTRPKKLQAPQSRRKPRAKNAGAASNGGSGKHNGTNDRRFVQAMGENMEWFGMHTNELLLDHPAWVGRCLAVASRTASKILAVTDDPDEALHEAARSPELRELAAREGMPANWLVTPLWLADVFDC